MAKTDTVKNAVNERLAKVFPKGLNRTAQEIVDAHIAAMSGDNKAAAERAAKIIDGIESGRIHLPGTDWRKPAKSAPAAV